MLIFALMNIDYKKKTISMRGRVFQLDKFKLWFIGNYQPLLAKYHVKKGTYDWHHILSDVQNNGIIEIFERESINKII